MSDASEEALVRRLKRGDSAAFDDLLQTHHPDVYRLAFRLTGSSETAESLTQDVFVQAFVSLKNFDGRSRLMTWLHTIAVRKVLDSKKTRDRRAAFSLSNAAPGHNEPIANTPDPSEIAHWKEMKHLLGDALLKLPEEERAALVLVLHEAMSYREAGEALRWPAGTVAWRVHNARRMLREMLAGPLQAETESP